ncbi:hypothetical protein ACTL32_10255 [Planococcus sp. FY231025]|uniref:hypothetical protein n=1 Tax=Planococcus sp. FY231025 TaxID=3455699 RepID=UPI003F93DD07
MTNNNKIKTEYEKNASSLNNYIQDMIKVVKLIETNISCIHDENFLKTFLDELIELKIIAEKYSNTSDINSDSPVAAMIFYQQLKIKFSEISDIYYSQKNYQSILQISEHCEIINQEINYLRSEL